jgi:RNA polymerase sigma-70 factor (ECF subfamily)
VRIGASVDYRSRAAVFLNNGDLAAAKARDGAVLSRKQKIDPRNQARMRDLVAEHMRFVIRTLSKAGVPQSEIDDEAQRTFIAVAGRLDDIRRDSERSFLFRVAHNTASHARRSLARRREYPSADVPEWIEAHSTPEDMVARKQARELLDDLLGCLDEPLREVFVLYELQGVDTIQIGHVLGIPRGTVASRLRRARGQLRKQAAAVEYAWDVGVEGVTEMKEPTILRRESMGALGYALLKAGVHMRVSETMHATTLACLALR